MLPRPASLLAAILAAHANLAAATAVLDCIGDAASARNGSRWRGHERLLPLDTARKVVAIQFRSTSLKGWRAASAKLVVHLDHGRCDGHLTATYMPKFDEKARAQPAWPPHPAAPTVTAACSEVGAGWWQIELPASIAQRLVDEPNGAILLSSKAKREGPVLHSRETLSFTPRLLVEGTAP